MPEYLVLTPDEKRLLQGLLDRERRRPTSPTRSTSATAEDPAGPEVYLVKTPAGGIPALATDIPGQADCDVYQRRDGDAGPVIATPGLKRAIANAGTDAIPADVWLLVARDKFGNWWPAAGAGGAGGGLLAGILDTALAAGGAATMSVYGYDAAATPPAWFDTLEDRTVTDWLLLAGQSVAVGKHVVAAPVHGALVLVAAQCE